MEMSEQPHALAGSHTRYPCKRKLAWHHSRFGNFGEEKISCYCLYSATDRPTRSLVTITFSS